MVPAVPEEQDEIVFLNAPSLEQFYKHLILGKKYIRTTAYVFLLAAIGISFWCVLPKALDLLLLL